MNYLALQTPVDTSYKQRAILDIGRSLASLSQGITHAAEYSSQKKDYVAEANRYYAGVKNGLSTADPKNATGYAENVPAPVDFKSLPESERQTAAKNYLNKIVGYTQQVYSSPDFVENIAKSNDISEEQAVELMRNGSNVIMKETGTPILSSEKFKPMVESAIVNDVWKKNFSSPIPTIEDVSKVSGIGEKPAASGSVASVATATEKPIDKSVPATTAIEAPKTAAPIAIGSAPAPAAPAAPAPSPAPVQAPAAPATTAAPPAAIGASQSKTTTVSKTAPAATGIVPPAKYDGVTDEVSQARAAYYDMISKKVSPERAATEAAKLFPDAQAKRIRELMTKNPDLGAGREMVTLIKTEMPWAQVDDKMLAAMQADVGMLEARKGRELAAQTERAKIWADRASDKENKYLTLAQTARRDVSAKRLAAARLESQIREAEASPEGKASIFGPDGNDTGVKGTINLEAAKSQLSDIRAQLEIDNKQAYKLAEMGGVPYDQEPPPAPDVDRARSRLVSWYRQKLVDEGKGLDAAIQTARYIVEKMPDRDVIEEEAAFSSSMSPVSLAPPANNFVMAPPTSGPAGVGPRPIPVQAPVQSSKSIDIESAKSKYGVSY